MAEHLTFGGSTAKRTMNCPGWVNESQGLPNIESDYAKRGTALHQCMEEMLLDESRKPEEYLGATVLGVEIDADMVTALADALEAFDDMCDGYGISLYEAETFCKLADDVGGTADFIARGDAGDKAYGIIGDFKFGQGIQVHPENNEQAMSYALAALHESDAKDLLEGVDMYVAVIIQPNDRDTPVLRMWEFGQDTLDAFGKQYLRAIAEARTSRPPINAGEHCKFCPAAGVCPERTGQALRALRMQPDDLDTLSKALELATEMKSWIKDVESTAFEQLNAGAPVTGWKLVAKRATAKWTSEEAVLKAFRRRLGGLKGMTVQKLLSPTQMAKHAKSRGLDIDFDDYVVRTSSGNTLAPEDDKRPAVLAGEAIAQALKGLK